ncbi:efflux RND transporter periplasmic adaptor subunit [Radiobacillus deserti]|uniref:Efflux RND transporter periplasmic adaptor subunit n=1 Tax=Radiobacillus deserti TaxID=2594883 RepID=A0A516KIM2_9BACI|nr:efflux RND transporter periplasmic adaptor subunit [Radiobacillus deserti]QDP41248.1 efflux RND transporter periplasmic adaptor subunit [Radiobacillus deserti]
MKKWTLVILLLLSVSLVGLNGYLISNKGDTISRTMYITDWEKAKTGDVIKSFSTKGVVVSSAKEDVFFDGEHKEFLRFLVKVGDKVEAGTPLFEYRAPEQEQLKASLEAEITQKEEDITSVERYMNSLRNYQVRLPDSNGELENRDYEIEEKLNIVGDNITSDMISSAITQEIFKQQLEMDRLEAEITKLEQELNSLQSGGNQAVLTEASTVAGTIIKLDKTLTNPVVTLATNNYSIEGKLTNNELQKVETGMDVRASVQGVKEELETSLTQVDDYPIEEPTVGENSFYRYQAALTEPSDSIAVGAKADVSILTEQANQVTTLEESAIQKGKKPYVYQLTKASKVIRKPIQLGLSAEGKVEIVSGLKSNDVVVKNPSEIHVDEKSYFASKMHPLDISWSSFTAFSKREWLELILIGLLEK